MKQYFSLLLYPFLVLACVAILFAYDWAAIPPLTRVVLAGASLGMGWNAFDGCREIQAGRGSRFVRAAVYRSAAIVFLVVVALNAMLRH